MIMKGLDLDLLLRKKKDPNVKTNEHTKLKINFIDFIMPIKPFILIGPSAFCKN